LRSTSHRFDREPGAGDRDRGLDRGALHLLQEGGSRGGALQVDDGHVEGLAPHLGQGIGLLIDHRQLVPGGGEGLLHQARERRIGVEDEDAGLARHVGPPSFIVSRTQARNIPRGRGPARPTP
jgi:hypothetical protein